MFRHGPRFTRFFAALCFLLAAASSSAQTTIHVPADQPSIQAGIDAAHDGDIVFVSPGTYTENIDFRGKSITLTSGATSYSDAGSVILQGNGRTPVVTIQGTTSVRGTLNGVTIQGGGNDDVNSINCGGIADVGASLTIYNSIVTANGMCGVSATSGANLVVAGSAIRTNNGTGLLLSTVGDVVLSSNVIEENVVPDSTQPGTNRGAGILIASKSSELLAANSLLLDHNVIRNNTAENDTALAMQIGSVIKNLTIVNNAFYGNLERHHDGVGIYLSGASYTPLQLIRTSLIETNNTVVGGGQLLIFNFAADSLISNNLLYNTILFPYSFPFPEFAGLSCTDPNLPLNIHNNDIYNVGSQINGGCRLGTNNLALEPQLRDIPGGDVREQTSSPLAGAGDLTAPLIPTTDLDGKNRTVCGKIDIGAYQLHPHPPIVLTATPNPTPGRSAVTLTAVLTGNCNTPTGTVTFLDGATVLGTAPVDPNGVATFTTSFLFVGTHTLTAHYPGDFNFEDSTSNAVTEVITGPPTITVLTTVTPNPALPFQAVTLTATVNSAYTVPQGTITFFAGSTALATVPVAPNGGASAVVSTLGAGTYAITAVYSGSTEYAASTSNVVTLVVVPAPSAVILVAAPNPVYQGQTVTFMVGAAGTRAPSPTATGTIQIFDGATPLGTVPLSNGQARSATSALAVGSHTITAAYSGDANLAPSTSSAVIEVVLASSFTLSLASPNLTFTAGQPQQVAVTLTSIGNYSGTLQLGTGPLPQYASASFSPASVLLTAGGTSASVTTLLTVAPLIGTNVNGDVPGTGLSLAALAGLPLLLLCRTRRLRSLLSALVACAALASLSGCGYVRSGAHIVAAGTYVIPITATDAQTGTRQTINLTLQITR